MKDKVVCILSVWRQDSVFFPPSSALFIFHIGVVWPTLVMRAGVTVCLESRGNAVQPCPRITAQPHGPLRQPPVCSDYSWTVKVKPCWHICVSLPQANSYYICLLLCSSREKRQESNALLKTGMAKNTDSWRKADSRLSGELQLLIFLTRAVRWLRTGFERNVDGLMVAACQCLYRNICVFPRLVSMLLGNVIFLSSV